MIDSYSGPNTKEITVAEVVLTYPGALTVFNRHNIDYCCGGKRSFRDACHKASLNSDTIWHEIVHGKHRSDSNLMRFNTWNIPLLIDYIIQNHHGYVRLAVPRIQELLDKVCNVHGEDHIELAEIRDDFGDLARELTVHMNKEEAELFPAVNALHENIDSHRINLEASIAMMEDEHAYAGDLVKSIRQLTHHYTIPRDACPTFTLLYKNLEEFDQDLMQHIHIENNVLFEKVRSQAD